MYDVKHRLAYQFKDKPNLNNFINALMDDDIPEALDDLLNKRGLNTSIGKQLEGIGEIVGLARPREPLDQSYSFGFLEDDEALTSGDLNDLDTGGYQYQLNPPLVVPVDDSAYRLAIRGKIFQNHTNMTVDETLEALSIVFQTKIRYFLTLNLHPMYEINKLLRPYEINILKNFPQTTGISETTYKIVDEFEAFGFLEDDEAVCAGNIDYPEIGGHLSSII